MTVRIFSSIHAASTLHSTQVAEWNVETIFFVLSVSLVTSLFTLQAKIIVSFDWEEFVVQR